MNQSPFAIWHDPASGTRHARRILQNASIDLLIESLTNCHSLHRMVSMSNDSWWHKKKAKKSSKLFSFSHLECCSQLAAACVLSQPALSHVNSNPGECSHWMKWTCVCCGFICSFDCNIFVLVAWWQCNLLSWLRAGKRELNGACWRDLFWHKRSLC